MVKHLCSDGVTVGIIIVGGGFGVLFGTWLQSLFVYTVCKHESFRHICQLAFSGGTRAGRLISFLVRLYLL